MTRGIDIDSVHDQQPQSGWVNALTRRIMEFFERNPEEWLTYEDMAIKFDVTEEQARNACVHLRRTERAYLETQHLVRMAPIGKPR